MVRTQMAMAALLLVVSVAGCLGGDDADPPERPQDRTNTPPPVGRSDGNGTSAPMSEPGVAEAPEWVVGQWWRLEVDHVLTDPVELTLVVADVSPTSYKVGYTDATLGASVLPLHVPHVGALTRPDLGFWYHDETFSVLDFPLTDGKTWNAIYRTWSLTYTARLSDTPGTSPIFLVEGVDADGVPHIRATYDAGQQQITDFAWGFDLDQEATATYVRRDSGFDHKGDVFVPTMRDALEIRAAGPDPNAPAPSEPLVEQGFTTDASATHLVLAAFVGNAEGVYGLVWRPSEGDPITMTQENPPGATTFSVFVEVLAPPPAGAWTTTATAVGPGFALGEAIAITMETVTLS